MRRIKPSGKIKEGQEGEAIADIQPRARAADGQEGRSWDAQVTKSPADALAVAWKKLVVLSYSTDGARVW